MKYYTLIAHTFSEDETLETFNLYLGSNKQDAGTSVKYCFISEFAPSFCINMVTYNILGIDLCFL
jgi:hypothetical protein